MSDEREQYQGFVRANREAYLEGRAAMKPKRSLAQRVRDFGSELARRAADRPALTVVPKSRRISGPRLVVDGAPEWHSIAGQAKLPSPVLGPRCRNCSLPVFAGADTLHGLAGLCGECMATLGGTIAAPPLKTGTDDGPRAA